MGSERQDIGKKCARAVQDRESGLAAALHSDCGEAGGSADTHRHPACRIADRLFRRKRSDVAGPAGRFLQDQGPPERLRVELRYPSSAGIRAGDRTRVFWACAAPPSPMRQKSENNQGGCRAQRLAPKESTLNAGHSEPHPPTGCARRAHPAARRQCPSSSIESSCCRNRPNTTSLALCALLMFSSLMFSESLGPGLSVRGFRPTRRGSVRSCSLRSRRSGGCG